MAKKANKAKRPKDKYYHLAKEQGYRARSAFKLIQLNKKYDFLSKSTALVDLCAAPGGWLQVAAKYMPAGSVIIGVDLMPIKPIRGVIAHQEDITTPQCRSLLKKDLGGRKVDVMLHDGAPNVGQNWIKDAFGQSELVLHSLRLATEFLRPHGMFITKVFRSADYNSLLWVFHQLFGKVESTKPHSSRTASAEIFVVCRDYKAPDRIDPRLLDVKYVFKEVDDITGTATGVAGGGGGHGLDVLHKKAEKHVRQREGYDTSLGPLLTKRMSVVDFVRASDPVRVLTDASCLVFDEEATTLGYTEHPSTTDEIRACFDDLKVLGKKDFKALLKWRIGIRHKLPGTLKRAAAAADEDADSGAEEDAKEGGSVSGGEEDETSAIDTELSAQAADELARRKREEKRSSKAKAKALRRQRFGMNLRSVDMLDTDESLFSFSKLKKLAGGNTDVLDSVRDLAADDTEDGQDDADREERDEGAVVLGGAEEDDDSEDSDLEGADGDNMLERIRRKEAVAELDDLEDELDTAYARYLANKTKQEELAKQVAETGKRSHGIKLTRRERLEQQALLTEAAMNDKLEDEHKKYVKLLGAARDGLDDDVHAGKKRKRAADDTGSDAEDDDDDDEDDDEDSDDEDASDDGDDSDGGEGAARGKPTGAANGGAGLSAATRAARWFSQDIFSDVLADEAVSALPSKKRAAAAADDSDSDGGAGSKRKAPVADKRKAAASGTIEVDSDGDAYPDWLAGIPKSDREKRKEKLRKGREREAKRQAAIAEQDGAGLEVVAGLGMGEEADEEFAAVKAREAAAGDDEAEGSGSEDSDADSTAPRSKKHQELIRKGLGKIADTDEDGDGVFEVVRGTQKETSDDENDSDADSDASSADPRDEDYDTDTQAEMLALGKMLKKHTTSKALVDASYNRYAFDDPALPSWFAQDESQHFRPQLPVSKAEMDAIKARLRDIAARPIHKVAEARARKKRRLQVQLDKAKRQAATIIETEEMGAKSKLKAIERAYKNAEIKRPNSVYVVSGKGKTGSAGGKKGGKVRMVDPRLKKDKRAQKNRDRKRRRT